eukprot:614794-Pyramimonas_sp.AAC.1
MKLYWQLPQKETMHQASIDDGETGEDNLNLIRYVSNLRFAPLIQSSPGYECNANVNGHK